MMPMPPRRKRRVTSGLRGRSGSSKSAGRFAGRLGRTGADIAGSAEGQLVGGFERCAAYTANHRGAVAAGERIVNRPRALRAPELGRCRLARMGWLGFGHLV